MKSTVILPFILLFLFVSCKKKLTEFEIDYNSEVVVASTFGQMVPFSISTPEVTTNSEYEFQNHDTRADKVNSVKLKDLVMTITSPSGETFSFLNSVQLFISSPNHAEKKIASKENIPDTQGNQLVCNVINTDLKDYIKDQSFTLRIETVTDETIAQDVHIDVYTNFLVDADIL